MRNPIREDWLVRVTDVCTGEVVNFGPYQTREELSGLKLVHPVTARAELIHRQDYEGLTP